MRLVQDGNGSRLIMHRSSVYRSTTHWAEVMARFNQLCVDLMLRRDEDSFNKQLVCYTSWFLQDTMLAHYGRPSA